MLLCWTSRETAGVQELHGVTQSRWSIGCGHRLGESTLVGRKLDTTTDKTLDSRAEERNALRVVCEVRRSLLRVTAGPGGAACVRGTHSLMNTRADRRQHCPLVDPWLLTALSREVDLCVIIYR